MQIVYHVNLLWMGAGFPACMGSQGIFSFRAFPCIYCMLGNPVQGLQQSPPQYLDQEETSCTMAGHVQGLEKVTEAQWQLASIWGLESGQRLAVVG